MKIPNMIILRIGMVGLSLMAGTGMASDGLSQQYCSNENTGSSFTPGGSKPYSDLVLIVSNME
jgi:hypothetical protein